MKQQFRIICGNGTTKWNLIIKYVFTLFLRFSSPFLLPTVTLSSFFSSSRIMCLLFPFPFSFYSIFALTPALPDLPLRSPFLPSYTTIIFRFLVTLIFLLLSSLS
jgi:hypothetical protein